MASSSHALIRKHFRRRFGVDARPVSIRPQASWRWRIVFWLVAVLGASGAMFWVFDAGQKVGGLDLSSVAAELDDLRRQRTEALEELNRLRVAASTAEGQLQVERATMERLSGQLAVLQQDNSALKQELAFFEGLAAGKGASAASPTITRATAAYSGKGPFRYRILVLNPQAGRKGEALHGELQFELKLTLSNQSVTINLPPRVGLKEPQFPVAVKHYLRLEGEFSLPESATLIAAEVRFVQGGQVLARQAMWIES